MGVEEKERKAKKLILDTVEEALKENAKVEDEKKRNAGRLALEKEILDNLAILGGRTFSEDEIERGGTKIRLPENMTYRQGMNYLKAVEESKESITSYSRVYNYRPWDGAYCAANALKRLFGSVYHSGRMGWFGMDPPEMITIPSGVGATVQVPWGSFELPFLPDVSFSSGGHQHLEKGALYRLTAEGPRKWQFEIEGIFNAIEKELQTNSLYRGKAFDGQEMPEFIDVYSIDADKVVFSEKVNRDLGAHIWARMRHPEQFTKRGVSLKRSILLHGPFGTGKTLACMVSGQIAVENGWTFIKARPGRDPISVVLQTARLYDPCLVVYEDVEGPASAEDTDAITMSRLLDDFDGIEAKGTKVMMVLTTNYPEKIHAGMHRPGRIDAFIEIGDLDQDGVEALVRSRIDDDLAPNIDWAAVFEAAEGFKPAYVTEGAHRTLGYVIDEFGTADDQLVDTTALISAMESMRDQYMRQLGAKVDQKIDPLSVALRREVGDEIASSLPEVFAKTFGWTQKG